VRIFGSRSSKQAPARSRAEDTLWPRRRCSVLSGPARHQSRCGRCDRGCQPRRRPSPRQYLRGPRSAAAGGAAGLARAPLVCCPVRGCRGRRIRLAHADFMAVTSSRRRVAGCGRRSDESFSNSHSGLFQPDPRPSSRRPSLSRSTIAAGARRKGMEQVTVGNQVADPQRDRGIGGRSQWRVGGNSTGVIKRSSTASYFDADQSECIAQEVRHSEGLIKHAPRPSLHSLLSM
jgi:hypothetical protein